MEFHRSEKILSQVAGTTQVTGLIPTWRDHRMFWVGMDLKDYLILSPLPWTGTPSTDQVLESPPKLALSTARDGAPTDLCWHCPTDSISHNKCVNGNSHFKEGDNS